MSPHPKNLNLPLFLKNKSIYNATGWWFIMGKKTFDKFNFSECPPEDFILTVIDKVSDRTIGVSSSLLSFPGQIKIPGLDKTFNELCKEKRIKIEISHRHYTTSQIPVLSSIAAYMNILTKQINTLLTPAIPAMDYFYTPFAGTDEPHVSLFQIAKHQGMAGITIPEVGLYHDEDNNKFLLANKEIFKGGYKNYQLYVPSKGIDLEHTLNNRPEGYEDYKWFFRGDTEPFVLCPAFVPETPDYFLMYLNSPAIGLSTLGVKRLLSKDHALPYCLSEEGVLIDNDDESASSLTIIETLDQVFDVDLDLDLLLTDDDELDEE
jgi:hypothetical protein